MEIPRQDETLDYYRVLPQPPQPESTTTVTDGAKEWVITSTPSKRTPQKHRQYWMAFWAVIERGGMIRTKGGLLKLKEEIEEWVG